MEENDLTPRGERGAQGTGVQSFTSRYPLRVNGTAPGQSDVQRNVLGISRTAIMRAASADIYSSIPRLFRGTGSEGLQGTRLPVSAQPRRLANPLLSQMLEPAGDQTGQGPVPGLTPGVLGK